MKTFLKIVGTLFFFMILSGACYLLLNLTMKSSIFVGISLLGLCVLIFSTSIYGLVEGRIKFLKLHNRIEVSGLLVGSILFALFICLFTLANTVLEYALQEMGLESQGKTRMLASTFLHQPTQRNLEKEKRNGITYVYPSGTEETVERFDALLQKKNSSFDAIFGNENMASLTIEIYNDLDTLRESPLARDVDGYYNALNQSIHVLKIDSSTKNNWEHYLLHEYTHYRIQQFTKGGHVPLWFEEGICEFMGYQYVSVDMNILEKVADFHLLDSKDSFHSASGDYNPYLQGYFAVLTLVNEHGTEVIPELLLSESLEDFYVKFEEITGKSISEFQQTFMEELELERKQMEEKFDLASDAAFEYKYKEAELILNEIKRTGFKQDADRANMWLVELYIEQKLYEKAIALLNGEIIDKDNDMYLANLMELAEIYLLFDKEKALHYAEIVENEAVNWSFFNLERTNKFMEALRKINAGDPIAGYKQLFDEKLIYSENIQNELRLKLAKEYPGQF